MKKAPTVSEIRASAWAARERIAVGRQLRTRKVEDIWLPAAPRLGLDATRGVRVALRLTKATCLQRSLVLQRWYADHGEPYDVVIGVTAPRAGFKAHAWLQMPGEDAEPGFTEITRLPASARTSAPAGQEVAT